MLTTSASAIAVRVISPLPSACIEMSTVVSTRHADSNITADHDEGPTHSVPIVACGTSPTPEVSETGNTSTMTTERIEPTDTDLVARARAGDGAAFGALVGRYQTAALRLAAAISGSADDAADIAQEAFVKAHRSLPRLTDPTMVRSWMLRIVANEAKNHLRGRDRRRPTRRAIRLVGDRRGARSGGQRARRRRCPRLGSGARPHRRTRSRRCSPIATSPDCRRPRQRQRQGVAIGTVKSRTARALARLRAEMERP